MKIHNQRYKKTPISSLMGMAMVVSTLPAHAVIIASDDFTYADGALEGSNGGSGWTGAWAKRPGTNTDAVNSGVASVFGNNSAVFDNQGASYRTMTEVIGDDENDVWIMVDMQRTSGAQTSAFVVFGLTFGAPPATGDPTGAYFVGEEWGSSSWGVTGTNIAGSDSTTMGTLVLHVNVATGDNELWLNPTSGQDLPAADVTKNDANTPGLFNTLVFRSGGAAGDHEHTFDNLVIATDAASLGFVTVPEPSSAAFLGLSALSLVLRRRR